jgi:hypothetical protein
MASPYPIFAEGKTKIATPTARPAVAAKPFIGHRHVYLFLF